MTDKELCYLSATEALSLFKKKRLSPVELLDALIEQNEIVEPNINAFSSVRFDIARQQAKAAEKVYMQPSATPRLLEGIPVALKNEPALEGDNTTNGSLILKDNIDTYNHPMTQHLLSSGAIIHARTNVPEFCCMVFTATPLHGITRSPWNPDLSCGGSSGGSGASLAAGTSTLATGSDIGGSIRIPACFNGVAGLKPTYGRVPEEPPFNFETYNHNGPMARNVKDCALLMNAISGPHPEDGATLRPKLEMPLAYGDIKNWKIAYSIDLGFFEVSPEVADNTLQAAEVLKDLGASVEEVSIPWDDRIMEAGSAHLSFMFAASIAEELETYRNLMADYTIKFADKCAQYSRADYLNALMVEGEMYRQFNTIMEKHDAFICPSLAVTGIPADGKGSDIDTVTEWLMTLPFNMLSRCPVLNLPTGFAANGMPTGMQIVGRTYDDISVFQVGASYEAATHWDRIHPQISAKT
jgi:amidase